jgi:hypothetical protein
MVLFVMLSTLVACSRDVRLSGTVRQQGGSERTCADLPHTIRVVNGEGELVGRERMTPDRSNEFAPRLGICLDRFSISLPKQAFYEFMLEGDETGATFSQADLESANYHVQLSCNEGFRTECRDATRSGQP